ncbi:MAG: LysE family transporter [Actinomycetota bacterium]|nr:LysE family transporter [Actinomycetota bacterium]
MNVSLVATLTFALTMTFSPGPNNIMSTSLGMMHGYRKALPLIAGIVCGFGIIMLLGAVAATILLGVVPAIQPFVKYVGAVYIVWLAWITWSHRRDFGAGGGAALTRTQGFPGGLALQFANPKAIAYSLVMYSTFLAGIVRDIPLVALSAVALAGVTFAATSTWALAGAGIRVWLNSDRRRAIAAGVLAAALICTAVELAGLPALVFG